MVAATTRLASVVTRDVSEHGVSVECLNGAAIPLVSPGLFPGGPRRAASRPISRKRCENRTFSRRFSASARTARRPAPLRIRAASARRTRSSGRRARRSSPPRGSLATRRAPPDRCVALPRDFRIARAESPVSPGTPHDHCWILTTRNGRLVVHCIARLRQLVPAPGSGPKLWSARRSPRLTISRSFANEVFMIDRREFVQSMIALGRRRRPAARRPQSSAPWPTRN